MVHIFTDEPISSRIENVGVGGRERRKLAKAKGERDKVGANFLDRTLLGGQSPLIVLDCFSGVITATTQ